MSIVKRGMEEDQTKREHAVWILIKAGVLGGCDRHEEIIYTVSGDLNLTEAYKIGNARWDTQFKDVFETRREMTDIIQAEAVNPDYGNNGCEICRGMMKD